MRADELRRIGGSGHAHGRTSQLARAALAGRPVAGCQAPRPSAMNTTAPLSQAGHRAAYLYRSALFNPGDNTSGPAIRAALAGHPFAQQLHIRASQASVEARPALKPHRGGAAWYHLNARLAAGHLHQHGSCVTCADVDR